jgi:hypothetical protein
LHAGRDARKKHYAGVLFELEGQPRKPAADVIREARER